MADLGCEPIVGTEGFFAARAMTEGRSSRIQRVQVNRVLDGLTGTTARQMKRHGAYDIEGTLTEKELRTALQSGNGDRGVIWQSIYSQVERVVYM